MWKRVIAIWLLLGSIAHAQNAQCFTITRYFAAGPQGAAYWLTDYPAAPGYPDAQNIDLPDRLPKQMLIYRARVRYEGTVTGQVGLFVDTKRRAYLTGDAPGHQINSDFTGDYMLVSMNGGTEIVNDFTDHPIPFDRTTDSLWFQLASQSGIFTIQWCYIGSVVMSGLLTTAQWFDALSGDATPGDPTHGESDAGGWTGDTVLTVIDPAAIDFLDGFNAAQLTYKGGAGGATVTQAAIGVRVPGTIDAISFSPVLFAGAASGAIPSSGRLISDLVTFPALLTGAGIVAKTCIGAPGVLRSIAHTPGWHTYWQPGCELN